MNAKGRAIQRLKRQVKKLASALSAVEELADRVNCEMSLLTEEDVAATTQKTPGRFAESLRATPLPDGSCMVSIDGSDAVRLSPRLWRLLCILADEKLGESSDDSVAWKRLADVRVKLSKEVGKKMTKGNLATLVWRLRNALGEDAELVQRRKADGLIRFALRRKTPPQVVISA